MVGTLLSLLELRIYTGPSYRLCFVMRANLELRLLRASSGKLTTHIILEQQA